MSRDTVLEVRDLATHFFLSEGVVKAVDGVELEVHENEIVAIVGESGSGKSVTALSIMRLINDPGKIVSGEIIHAGQNLLKLSSREIQKIRGSSISMVFQNPHSALHPHMKIGRQMVESTVYRTGSPSDTARQRSVDLLSHIGVENAADILERYPFEVSAGVSQRVMLAMALMSKPKLLIADEPTTNLDALSQIQFLKLVKQMRDEFQMSVLIITHDFGVVSMLADRVVVMYAGRQMESGPIDRLIEHPRHPYTSALLNSVRVLAHGKGRRLEQIPGEVPDVMRLPPGCSFRPRCPHAMHICRQEPPVIKSEPDRSTRCWLYSPEYARGNC